MTVRLVAIEQAVGQRTMTGLADQPGMLLAGELVGEEMVEFGVHDVSGLVQDVYQSAAGAAAAQRHDHFGQDPFRFRRDRPTLGGIPLQSVHPLTQGAQAIDKGGDGLLRLRRQPLEVLLGERPRPSRDQLAFHAVADYRVAPDMKFWAEISGVGHSDQPMRLGARVVPSAHNLDKLLISLILRISQDEGFRQKFAATSRDTINNCALQRSNNELSIVSPEFPEYRVPGIPVVRS